MSLPEPAKNRANRTCPRDRPLFLCEVCEKKTGMRGALLFCSICVAIVMVIEQVLSGSPTVRGMSARWFGRKLLWGEQTKKMTQGGSETQVGSAFGQPTLLSRCEWELASATWSALPMEVGSNAPHLSACARRGIAKRSRRIRLPPVARGHLRIGIAFRQSRRRSAGSARRAARLASQPSPLRTPRLAGSRP